MTRLGGPIAGDVEQAPLRPSRPARDEVRIALEVRWRIAEAALSASGPDGACSTDECELLGIVDLRLDSDGRARALLTTQIAGRTACDERSARISAGPRRLIGRAGMRPTAPTSHWEGRRSEMRSIASAIADGWTSVRLSGDDGLGVDILLRPARPGRRGVRRVAYLKTNLPGLLGLAGGRYASPVARVLRRAEPRPRWP